MTPAEIDRVFGRSRLRMVTGDHVEVFREASLPGERRRYTKRFLATPEGDFREWTEREWRILARLVGHGIQPVPDVVQFDRGAADRPALVQTFDAGVTVDHWATLLPLERDGTLLRNVFEDCAHWWSLARHSLLALDAIHELRLVHLDLKADNLCIPVGPPDFDPLAGSRSLHPRFEAITLIDFAFSLVSGERLKSALPIAAQRDYEYQSPRLLRALEAGREGDLGPTRQLDWRCDLFSLAAMLWRYLPELDGAADRAWTRARHDKASALVRRLVEAHDSELPSTRPHAELIALASEPLGQPDLRRSLQRGWTLAIDASAAARAAPTPITRIALPLAAPTTPTAQAETSPPFDPGALGVDRSDIDFRAIARGRADARRSRHRWWAAGAAAAVLAVVALAGRTWLAPPARLTTADVHVAHAGPAPAAKAAPPAASRPAIVVPAAVPAAVPDPVAAVASSPAVAPAPAAVAADAMTTGAASAPSAAGTTVASASSMPVAGDPGKAPAVDIVVSPRPRSVSPSTRSASARPSPAERPTRVAARPVFPPRPGNVAGARTSSPHEARIAASRQTVSPAAPVKGFPSQATIVAQARVKALMQQQAEVRARKASRAAAPAARPPAASETATPWAVTGKPPPGEATTPGVAPALVPATAPALSTPSSALPAQFEPVDFTGRAADVMNRDLPRLAQRAERLVARVLFMAGRSQDVVGDREILDSAASLGAPAADPVTTQPWSPADARRLDDAARNEYDRHGASAQAVQLQLRAFGADPLDPDIAGNLAFLMLRRRPSDPESARQLALHALTVHGSRYPQGRSEDWATLAIASALVGRERDARNALLVSLAMAPNLDRQCRAAIDVFALYGERLRAPVEAMIRSARASSRVPAAGACEWPPRWTVTSVPRTSQLSVTP